MVQIQGKKTKMYLKDKRQSSNEKRLQESAKQMKTQETKKNRNIPRGDAEVDAGGKNRVALRENTEQTDKDRRENKDY